MEIKVTGLREVEKQLQELGSKTGTRIIRASMLASVKPILEDARARLASVPQGSGALHQALGAKFYAGKRNVPTDAQVPEMGGRFSVQVGPFRRNRIAVALHNLYYNRKRKGIFYGHLIEFGHRIVRLTGQKIEVRKRNRTYTKFATIESGQAAARPFLGPALISKGPEAVQTFAQQLKARIERQLKKNAKK